MTNQKAGESSRVRWLRLALTLFIFVALSVGLAVLLQASVNRLNLPLYDIAWLAYLLVFGLSVLANLSVIVPVPFAASIMIAAATEWNPVLVTLAGSLGGAIGELSGYYAGYLGKKIAIPEDLLGYQKVEGWLKRWGFWAVFFLAFQPIIPFDVGGLVAGTARMPLHKFLPAIWAGKFLKYLILAYAGVGLTRFIPFFSR